jgi:hypothetical protein
MILNFIPELWSALLNGYLKKLLVYGNCCNRIYEGQIKQMGDRVHITEIGDVTVSPYVRGTTELSYESLLDAGLLLSITESKSFAFKLDDCDKVQAAGDLIGPATEKAAYAIKDTMDQFIAATLAAEPGITAGLGTSTTPLEINSVNVRTILLLIARKLDDGKSPRAGRWIVIPPWMVEDLVKADVVAGTPNRDLLAEGFITRAYGFDVMMSHNVPNTTSTKYKILAGTPFAATFAQQLQQLEALRLEGSFSDALRGLFLYGARATHPEALAMAICNEAAEA